MKKVVERVQKENDELKKAPGVTTQTEIHDLRDENKELKVGVTTTGKSFICTLQKSLSIEWVSYVYLCFILLRADFFKNLPGHWDQGWTNLSKLGPYTSIDEPLFMAMKIPTSVAPVFLDGICLISLIWQNIGGNVKHPSILLLS